MNTHYDANASRRSRINMARQEFNLAYACAARRHCDNENLEATPLVEDGL